MHPVMNQLLQLPPSERLIIVQELWDSIGQSREEMPIQDWHRELVKARLAEFENQPEDYGLTLDEVWQQVDQRRGT